MDDVVKSEVHQERTRRRAAPFLYHSSTLPNVKDVFNALFNQSMQDTPKGTLSDDEILNDTAMRPRKDIWNMAASHGKSLSKTNMYAKYYWIDDQLRALVDFFFL